MARPPQSGSDASKDGKGGFAQTAIPLVVMTLVAGGGGGFLGYTLVGAPPPSPPRAEAESAAKPAHEAAGHGDKKDHGAPADAASAPVLQLKEFPPIVTNLGSPETSWVRLQAAIVFDAKATPHPDILIAELMADAVAFLRTLPLSSLEGADGLRRLQEDLSERATLRSEGRVREFIIQTMVVQ